MRRPGGSLLAVSLLLVPLLSGCAGFWDEITSKDFHVKTMFAKTDPMVVLRDSPDGDKRAKAIRSLQEPLPNGGTQQEQDAVIKIVVTASTNERQPLCRLAAMQKLSEFKDPRAVEGLKEAYYAAGSFPPDVATVLRCQALKSLGDTKNPAAVDLLAKVVREPPGEGTEEERQQMLDMRTAAARSLANFKNAEGYAALVSVLKSEKDVALRDRARDSLAASTGQDVPADAAAWEQKLQELAQGKPPATDPNPIQKVAGWFKE